MAGNDPQRQLLTLIRDFASERSHGEKRVVGLKKRIGELRSELDAATAELEEAKRSKETAEQEIKGYEVESSRNDSSILALELLENTLTAIDRDRLLISARVSLIQDEISSVATEVESLKSQEGALRDEFISHMFQVNSRIRKLQESFAFYLQDSDAGASAEAGNGELVKKEGPRADSKSLDDMLAYVLTEAAKVEQECVTEEHIQKQLQQEYVDLHRKVSLIGVIMQESKALQDIASLLNWKAHVDTLARNCRRNAYAPVAARTIQSHWAEFSRETDCKYETCSQSFSIFSDENLLNISEDIDGCNNAQALSKGRYPL